MGVYVPMKPNSTQQKASAPHNPQQGGGQTTLSLSGTTEPAGFWKRLLAMFLDSMVVGMIQVPIFTVFFFVMGASMMGFVGAMQSGQMPSAAAVGGVGAILIGVLVVMLFSFVATYYYFAYFYKKKGATPGKAVLGLKVLDSTTGAHLGYGKTFLREVLWKMLFGFIVITAWGVFAKLAGLSEAGTGAGTLLLWTASMACYVCAGIRKDKKAVHDLIFKTQVVCQKK